MYIYGIFDKTTGECLYIGKSLNPDKRKSDHMRKKFKDKKDDIELKILRECTEEKAIEWERIYIKIYRCKYKLENYQHNTSELCDYVDGDGKIRGRLGLIEKNYTRGKLGDKRNHLKYWSDLMGYEFIDKKYQDYNGERKYSVWKIRNKIFNINEVFIGEQWTMLNLEEIKKRLRTKYNIQPALYGENLEIFIKNSFNEFNPEDVREAFKALAEIAKKHSTSMQMICELYLEEQYLL